MSTEATSSETEGAGFQGQIPPVEPLLTEVIATLALAAHAYLADQEGREPDLASAEIAIDVATSTFERVKERMTADQRLAIAQMLTEMRMLFVRKRGS